MERKFETALIGQTRYRDENAVRRQLSMEAGHRQ